MENMTPGERPGSPEAEGMVDQLAERLGFKETDELRRIRELAIEASGLGDKDRVAALVREYQLHGEEMLGSLQGEEYARGQIGLIVARATLSRDMGDIASFLYHVGDASDYAVALQEEHVIPVLERAPSIEIGRILLQIGEEYGFDEETVAEISAEPYDEAFQMAYGYLIQAGLDADEILAPFVSE